MKQPASTDKHDVLRIVPQPAREELPSAVTFFVKASQRRAILQMLRTVHADRAVALLTILGIDPHEASHDHINGRNSRTP